MERGSSSPWYKLPRRQTGRRKFHGTMIRDLVEGHAKCPKNSTSRGLEVITGLCSKG